MLKPKVDLLEEQKILIKVIRGFLQYIVKEEIQTFSGDLTGELNGHVLKTTVLRGSASRSPTFF